MSKPRWFAICERLCLVVPAFFMALTTLLLLVVAMGQPWHKGVDFFLFGVCGWTFVYAALGGISYGGLHLARWALDAGKPPAGLTSPAERAAMEEAEIQRRIDAARRSTERLP